MTKGIIYIFSILVALSLYSWLAVYSSNKVVDIVEVSAKEVAETQDKMLKLSKKVIELEKQLECANRNMTMRMDSVNNKVSDLADYIVTGSLPQHAEVNSEKQ